MRRFAIVGVLAAAALFAVAIAGASTPGADVRLTNDCHPMSLRDCGDASGVGYVSDYTLATGIPYTDQTLDECTVSRGSGERACRRSRPAQHAGPARQLERLLRRLQPRGCRAGAVGPIWLGYYRSREPGRELHELARPGLPGRPLAVRGAVASPHRECRRSRHRLGQPGPRVLRLRELRRSGRLDENVRGRVRRTVREPGGAMPRLRPTTASSTTARPSSRRARPRRTCSASSTTRPRSKPTARGGACDGNVYFSWSRFTGNGGVGIYFSRSTDHGVTFSSPMKLTPSIHDVQFPDISVTGNGHVYVTFRQFDDGGKDPNAVMITKSTDCGKTFSTPAARDAVHRERRPGPVGSGGDAAAAVAARRSELRGRSREPRQGRARHGTAATSRMHAHPASRSSAAIPRSARQPTSSIRRVSGCTSSTTRRSREPRQPTGSTYHTIEPGDGRPGRRRSSSATTARTAAIRHPVVIDNESGRSPGVPGHLGRRRRPARDLVGQPVRSVLQRDEADRQLRQPHDGAVAGRLRRHGPTTTEQRGRRQRRSRTTGRTRTGSSSTTARCRLPATTSG